MRHGRAVAPGDDLWAVAWAGSSASAAAAENVSRCFPSGFARNFPVWTEATPALTATRMPQSRVQQMAMSPPRGAGNPLRVEGGVGSRPGWIFPYAAHMASEICRSEEPRGPLIDLPPQSRELEAQP